MGDSDLDDEFVHEIDDNDSGVDVSSIVPNVQEETRVRFINSIITVRLVTFLCVCWSASKYSILK